MKKKIFALGTALCLALCLTVPALAAQDYGLIYDATDLLDQQAMNDLANDTFYPLTEKYKVQVRIDVVDNLEEETVLGYPHDKLYGEYICARICEATGEVEKANNWLSRYNDFFDEFAKWWIRNYHPGQCRM